jgi:hypothetical protein
VSVESFVPSLSAFFEDLVTIITVCGGDIIRLGININFVPLGVSLFLTAGSQVVVMWWGRRTGKIEAQLAMAGGVSGVQRLNGYVLTPGRPQITQSVGISRGQTSELYIGIDGGKREVPCSFVQFHTVNPPIVPCDGEAPSIPFASPSKQ